MKILAPSILSADFANLQSNIDMAKGAGARWLHFDVMDGQFVPQISFGMPVCKSVRKSTDMVLDVHLMIVEPHRYIEDFYKAGAEVINIHAESYNAPVMTAKGTRVTSPEVDINKIKDCLGLIRSLGAKAGLTINPDTPVAVFEDFLEDIDLALIMSVYPGFGGQAYIPQSTQRIAELKQRIGMRSILIEVDGGIYLENAAAVMNAGADVLVAGSAVFDGDIVKNTENFMRLINQNNIN